MGNWLYMCSAVAGKMSTVSNGVDREGQSSKFAGGLPDGTDKTGEAGASGSEKSGGSSITRTSSSGSFSAFLISLGIVRALYGKARRCKVGPVGGGTKEQEKRKVMEKKRQTEGGERYFNAADCPKPENPQNNKP